MVPLDRALVSCYRLPIVTMSLSTAVWPQFAQRIVSASTIFVEAVSCLFTDTGSSTILNNK